MTTALADRLTHHVWESTTSTEGDESQPINPKVSGRTGINRLYSGSNG
jgi:hypothetical protein